MHVFKEPIQSLSSFVAGKSGWSSSRYTSFPTLQHEVALKRSIVPQVCTNCADYSKDVLLAFVAALQSGFTHCLIACVLLLMDWFHIVDVKAFESFSWYLLLGGGDLSASVPAVLDFNARFEILRKTRLVLRHELKQLIIFLLVLYFVVLPIQYLLHLRSTKFQKTFITSSVVGLSNNAKSMPKFRYNF